MNNSVERRLKLEYLHRSRLLPVLCAFTTLSFAVQLSAPSLNFNILGQKSDIKLLSHDHWKLINSKVIMPVKNGIHQSKSDLHVHKSLGSTAESNRDNDVHSGYLQDSVDPLMAILKYSKTFAYSGEWSVHGTSSAMNLMMNTTNSSSRLYSLPYLTCTPFSNSTQYDHLKGLLTRSKLGPFPEPDVFKVFKKGSIQPSLHDVHNSVFEKLVAAPQSPHTLNQAGNLLRVYGDSVGAVECFRKALFYSPSNPDVLLNLARVLFSHKFLDDAIYLTRRSLETQPAERNAWLQHFTLGEILKSYGHIAEAMHHLRQSLSLNPDFPPAVKHLQQLESTVQPSLTLYTLAIITFLILCVLATILTTAEANLDSYGEVMKTQRHFNRAMAMKTLRLSIGSKISRTCTSAKTD